MTAPDGTILLVEDNPDDVELALRALSQNGVEVRTVVARDGAAALDYFFGTGEFTGRDPSEPPTLTLLDLKLPKVDGHEVLRRVRADARTCMAPIVLLTSSREPKDIARGYALGANSYIRKPVRFSEFVEAIRQVALYWLVLNEAPPRTPAR